MDSIGHLFGEYGELALSVLGLFAAIATLVPAPREDSSKLYKFFYVLLSAFACNFGRAKNMPRPPKTKGGHR